MPALRLLVVLLVAGCDLIEPNREENERKRHDLEAWVAPCSDYAVLLATTAGSPNDHVCTNKDHRMRVQVATTKSNEEAAALVFCECVRDGGK
jgi:hypothetical protein